MSKSKLSKKAKNAIDKIIARFESGDLSPIVYAAMFEPPDSWTCHGWTFRNRVIAYSQADTLHCRGFQQWREVGRHVKKGGQSIYIWAPMTYKKRNDETGEDETRVRGYRPIPVFPSHQTEQDEDGGTPLADLEPEYQPKEMPPLANVAEAFGIKVTWTANAGDHYGSFTPGENKIRMNTESTKTWFHELAHAIHYKINKYTDNVNKEALAEFTACVLMALYEVDDTTGYSWHYIRSHSKDPMQAIMKALGTIEQVLEAIETEVQRCA